NLSQTSGPGEIFLCARDVPADRLNSIIRGLNLVPRSVMVIPDDDTASLLQHRLTAIGTDVAVEIRKAPLNLFQRGVKRSLDVVLSAVAIVILSPLLALIALAIKLDSKGPVLFRQGRSGWHGDPFRIFKFRTMTVLEDGPELVQASREDK